MGLVQMRDLEIGDEFFYRNCRYRKTTDLGFMLCILNCLNITENVERHLSPYTKVVPV